MSRLEILKKLREKNPTLNHQELENILDIFSESLEKALLDNDFIKPLPKNIVVEVPAIINKKGIKGINLKNYPAAFGRLLNNQVGTIEQTTEAVLKKSKYNAYLALLCDPIVDNTKSAEKLLNSMLEFQKEYLGYLK